MDEMAKSGQIFTGSQRARVQSPAGVTHVTASWPQRTARITQQVQLLVSCAQGCTAKCNLSAGVYNLDL